MTHPTLFTEEKEREEIKANKSFSNNLNPISALSTSKSYHIQHLLGLSHCIEDHLEPVENLILQELSFAKR